MGADETDDLPLITVDRRHALLEHVRRLPEDTPTHCTVLTVQKDFASPTWKRPLGHPRKFWLQQVLIQSGPKKRNPGFNFAITSVNVHRF